MKNNIALNRRLLTTSGLIVGAILFFAVNILANTGLQHARLDLTDSRLYTLAQGTRNILGGLQEPITLRFYLSKKLVTDLPGINAYALRVEELLHEFAREANGKLKLVVVDPEPFSEEEDRAVSYGLQGVPLDETGGATFYFGIVGTNSVDKEEVIPFLNPNRSDYLEYDLARTVYQLSTNKPPVIGVISTIPLEGGGPQQLLQPGSAQALAVYEQMQQQFQIQTLQTDVDTIPDDVSVLMLVHPKDFSDATLYAIDQFVLRGGKALVFVDPYAESAEPGSNPMMGGQGPSASNLDKLFASWGVHLIPNVTVGDLDGAKKVRFNAGPRPAVMDYPVWMDLTAATMSQSDIVMAQLSQLTFATPGVIEPAKDATTQFSPLVQTGPRAAKIDTARLGMFANPQDLLRDFRPEGQLTVAARITGPAKSAFANGAPPKTADESAADKSTSADSAPAKEHLTETKEPINVIVVADSDFLQDQWWADVQGFFGQRLVMPNSGNGSFVISALDNLLGSNDLINVRNRGGFARPFTRLKALQQDAEQQFLEKEKELRAQLQDTERKLTELQRSKGGDSSLILSPEQEQELARFRSEKVRIRKELRDVQHELRKNIENIEGVMKFVNIGLMPLLVGVTGVAVGIYRIRRKRALQKPVTQAREAAA